MTWQVRYRLAGQSDGPVTAVDITAEWADAAGYDMEQIVSAGSAAWAVALMLGSEGRKNLELVSVTGSPMIRLCHDAMDEEVITLELKTADQVTEEIIKAAYEIADGWYQGVRIDWNDVLDRLDGTELADGSVLDLGTDMLSPAIQEIQKRVRKMRRES